MTGNQTKTLHVKTQPLLLFLKIFIWPFTNRQKCLIHVLHVQDSISAVIAKYSSNGYMDILQEKWYGGLPCFKLATDMAQPRPLGVAAVTGKVTSNIITYNSCYNETVGYKIRECFVNMNQTGPGACLYFQLLALSRKSLVCRMKYTFSSLLESQTTFSVPMLYAVEENSV